MNYMISLTEYLHRFDLVTKKPYEFLSIQEETAKDIKELTKHLYDFTKKREEHNYKNTLPKLIVDQFDEEQIWQELELQNGVFTNENTQIVSQLSAKKDKLNFPLELKCTKGDANNKGFSSVNDNIKTTATASLDGSEDEIDELEEDYEDFEEDYRPSDDDKLSEDSFSEEENNLKLKGKQKPSIVDDQFFKLSELEQFLKNEEQHEDKQKKDKDNWDLFENIDGDADYKYSDFFENPENSDNDGPYDKFLEDDGNNEEEFENDDKDGEQESDNDNEKETIASNKVESKRKFQELHGDQGLNEEFKDLNDSKKKKVRFSLLDSDDEEAKSENPRSGHSKDLSTDLSVNKSYEAKSSLEKRKERLDKVIGRLEEDAMAEKPWQLKGEVSGNLRPENSLLEEAVDFDMSVRPAPIMTGEVTMKLEDIIMQRIKDKAWDDVERKVKPVDTPSEFKKKLALDQEKSKLSLAEVYEQEFVKQREAATADDTERQETEPALHVEVRSMLLSLFNKLDALSNYHYTPRPVAPELKVVSNVAAIAMEEVAPVATADSALLAPQEVRGKKFRDQLMSKEERTDTDKKRARRLKKTMQRQRKREKERAAKEISKINPGLGNKYSKLKAEKQLLDVTANNVTKMDQRQDKVVKSSTAFFNKLQDEVKSQIKTKTSTFAKKKDKKNITAKKLKL